VSTENALFILLDEILTAINNISKAKGIFCDSEIAFDCVNHDILLNKMELYGISGISKTLYTQYIKIDISV
jgi:hypothetical protein